MGSDGGYNSDTWWFDATANTWNYTSSFSGEGRRSAASFVINDKAYLTNGYDGDTYKNGLYLYVKSFDV